MTVLERVRSARRSVCHGDRASTVEHNPWRSLVQGVGWLLVAWSTTVPLLGHVLWVLPVSGAARRVVEAVVPWMTILPLSALTFEVGALVLLCARVPVPTGLGRQSSARDGRRDG